MTNLSSGHDPFPRPGPLPPDVRKDHPAVPSPPQPSAGEFVCGMPFYMEMQVLLARLNRSELMTLGVPAEVTDNLTDEAVDAMLAERRAELYNKLADSRGTITKFLVLGVQIVAGDDRAYSIGMENHQTRTTSSRPLGPLAGAEAMVADGSHGQSPSGAMLPPDTLAWLAKKTKTAAIVLFTNGVVCTHWLDSDSRVLEAQEQVAQFNAVAGTGYPGGNSRAEPPAV